MRKEWVVNRVVDRVVDRVDGRLDKRVGVRVNKQGRLQSNRSLSCSTLTVEGIKGIFTYNIWESLTTSAPRPPPPNSVLIDG